ncbi:hypothetical protein ACLOJK_021511 [Asimina triloba]
MGAWGQYWWNILMIWSCPEMLPALACFFLLNVLVRNRKSHAVIDWPLVGMLPSLLLNVHRLHDWTTEVMAASGMTLTFRSPWFARMETTLTCDPANVNHVMSTNFANFPKGPDFFQMFDILGDGIFNSDSDSWSLQRKMANAHLKCARFRSFMSAALKDKVENALLPILRHLESRGQHVDMQDVFQRFTFDSTCSLVLGDDPGCLSLDFPDVPIVKAMDDAAEAVLLRHVVPFAWWKLQRWLDVGPERKLREAWEIIDDFMYKNIWTRRQEGISKDSGDLLASYIEEAQGSSNDISDKFLRDTALNFLFAGKDTGAAAITWFLWTISEHPRAENMILEELRSIIAARKGGKDDRKANKPTTTVVFEAEELNGLVYLHAALCETLRLYPPVPFEHKGVFQLDILPSGAAVGADTKIMFPLYSMGRMEAIWGADCLEFKPERWITERGTLKFQPSYKFMAFNTGPRTCLGKEVAFAQIKVVAAAVLYNFHVHVLDGHPVSPKMSVVLHMKNGLMAKIAKRSHVEA